MKEWINDEIPEEGYIYRSCLDYRHGFDSVDYESDSNIVGMKCNKCEKNTGVFIHFVSHRMYTIDAILCRNCAEIMIKNNIIPLEKELENQKIYELKVDFLKLEGQTKSNGNIVLKYNGKIITIMKSKYNDGLGVVYEGKQIWKYYGRTISDIRTAKLAAFNFFELYKGLY